ncbi:hypothetical protein BCR44DRAFT_1280996 [Catenaria anguillulae PL171]|uniref:Uncharacterized protein n=1 Tax=Catenaria anguillulae PL171 TaxID=765915 RepID=A0A1Y2HVT7_9FUNG|nr:hypothetical protein BCR44DRAFT_1280996 [Catenaria anguillulae PL171]
MEQDEEVDDGGYSDERGECSTWGEERTREGCGEVESTLVEKYAHDWDVELDHDDEGGDAASGVFGFAAGAAKVVAPANAFAPVAKAGPVGGVQGNSAPDLADSALATKATEWDGAPAAATATTSHGSSHSSLPQGEPMDDGDDDYDDDDDGYVYRPSSP